MDTLGNDELLDARMLLKEANLIQVMNEHDLLRLRNRRAVELSEQVIDIYAEKIREDILDYLASQVQERGIMDVLAEVEGQLIIRDIN